MSTDFGNNVYVGTIAGKPAESYLDNEDKAMVRKIFSEAREIYRESVQSVFGDTKEEEWNSIHADAYSKAFSTAMLAVGSQGESKTDDTCTGDIFPPPETSCLPSKSSIRDLAIIPQVLTAKQLLTIVAVPSAEPALDIHTICPSEGDDSFPVTVSAVSTQATESQAPTNTGTSGAVSSLAGMDSTGSRKRRRVSASDSDWRRGWSAEEASLNLE